MPAAALWSVREFGICASIVHAVAVAFLQYSTAMHVATSAVSDGLVGCTGLVLIVLIVLLGLASAGSG